MMEGQAGLPVTHRRRHRAIMGAGILVRLPDHRILRRLYRADKVRQRLFEVAMDTNATRKNQLKLLHAPART